MPQYDSRSDTRKHIETVKANLLQVVNRLLQRGIEHDASKLEEPEKSAFDTLTPKLRDVEYGSDEYRSTLKEMKPAIEHHYAHNQHHPEYWENGINDMSLLDLVEMVADWKAASMRHANGDMMKSMEINKERFGIDDQLYQVILNTLDEMAWW